MKLLIFYDIKSHSVAVRHSRAEDNFITHDGISSSKQILSLCWVKIATDGIPIFNTFIFYSCFMKQLLNLMG